MILKQCFLTRNDCYQKGQKIDGGKPTGIVVHSTGANNPSLKRYVQPLKTDSNYDELIADLGVNKYKNSWNTSYKAGETGRKVCVHAFIGKNDAGIVETYQTLPFDICCWGCASGSKGSYNRNPTARIQFEICEDSLKNREYFDAVFKEAAEFCAYLCNTYGFGVDKICSHHEAHLAGYGNNHGDCDHWLKKFGLTMDWFRAEVQKLLTPEKQLPPNDNPQESPICPSTENETGKKVIHEGDLVRIAEGASYYSGEKSVPSWVQKQNWYVKRVSGDRVVIGRSESGKNSISSTINAKFLSIVKARHEQPVTPSVTPIEPDAQPLDTKDTTQAIWDFLYADIGNALGVAALMGNLQAESSLKPTNLQGSYEKSLGFTDETYTSRVDDESYDNFVNDHAGYGLAQWTYYSRKQNLLDYAKSKGVSIGDLRMQLEFLLKELSSYKTVYAGLKAATSLKAASDLVLTKYEKPANQSEENKERRASLGQAFYDKFAGEVASDVAPITANVKRQMVIDKYTSILGRNNYSQSKRDYCFRPYSDGKYYSDCSSSISYCYKEAGFGFGILNTVGMYQSNKLQEVPVVIKNGQIQNPEVLRLADMLLFAGTDDGRAYAGYVGHVEMVYAIDGTGVMLCGHSGGTPNTKSMTTYCKSRYTAKTNTPVGNKGLIKVVRYIQDDINSPEYSVTQVPNEPVDTRSTVTVTGVSVNIRKGPGMNYAAVGVAKKGTELKKADADGWIPVLGDGAVFWISSEYAMENEDIP